MITIATTYYTLHSSDLSINLILDKTTNCAYVSTLPLISINTNKSMMLTNGTFFFKFTLNLVSGAPLCSWRLYIDADDIFSNPNVHVATCLSVQIKFEAKYLYMVLLL